MGTLLIPTRAGPSADASSPKLRCLRQQDMGIVARILQQTQLHRLIRRIPPQTPSSPLSTNGHLFALSDIKIHLASISPLFHQYLAPRPLRPEKCSSFLTTFWRPRCNLCCKICATLCDSSANPSVSPSPWSSPSRSASEPTQRSSPSSTRFSSECC